MSRKLLVAVLFVVVSVPVWAFSEMPREWRGGREQVLKEYADYVASPAGNKHWFDCHCLECIGVSDKVIGRIRSTLVRQDVDFATWKKAAMAATFMGSEGAGELMRRLRPALSRKDYGERTKVLLTSLGGILDRRSREVALEVLESGAPTDVKLVAIGMIPAQINSISIKDKASEPVEYAGGTVYPGTSGVHWTLCAEEVYSVGVWPDDRLSAIMAVRGRLVRVLWKIQGSDSKTAKGIRDMIARVDKNVAEVQELFREQQRKNQESLEQLKKQPAAAL